MAQVAEALPSVVSSILGMGLLRQVMGQAGLSGIGDWSLEHQAGRVWAAYRPPGRPALPRAHPQAGVEAVWPSSASVRKCHEKVASEVSRPGADHGLRRGPKAG